MITKIQIHAILGIKPILAYYECLYLSKMIAVGFKKSIINCKNNI